MVRAIPLDEKLDVFTKALNDGWNFGDYRYGILDVNVMMKLGCTPQRWSRWRPQLIQYCAYHDLITTANRGGVEYETSRIKMRYDKRNKMGYGKKEHLWIKDKYCWYMMSDEQIEKYNLEFWVPEENFMYC